jgi:hypothetical protein
MLKHVVRTEPQGLKSLKQRGTFSYRFTSGWRTPVTSISVFYFLNAFFTIFDLSVV